MFEGLFECGAIEQTGEGVVVVLIFELADTLIDFLFQRLVEHMNPLVGFDVE
ncbi:hypothetical protein D3C81_2184370 [compost metagenome]